MELSLTRNEKIFALLGLAVIIAFLVAFTKLTNKPRPVSQFETTEAINYQMERPEEAFAGYSLEGRDIDERFEGLKKAAILVRKPVVAAKPAVKDGKAKPTVAAKKVAPVASSKKEIVANKIVSSLPSGVRAEAKRPESTAVAVDNNRIPQRYEQQNNVALVEPNLPAKPDIKNKKSFTQWRADIFAKQNKEVVTAFINAHRAGDISAAEFQAMAQDLIDQEDIKIKGLGLMALRAQPSMASLSQMVHVQAQLPAELQSYVEEAYLAYLQPQHVGVFNQVFQSQDKKLVLKSLTILGVNIQKIKSGDVASFIDARQRRDADAPQMSLNSFRSLLPSLTAMSSSPEPGVSQMAAQVAELLQSSAQVAGL